MTTKAKESKQVARAREKLKKQIATEDQRINAEALKQMKDNIQHWIQRHSSDRIPLKDKDISLFDENHHPAKTKSRFVQHMLKELNQAPAQKTTKNILRGRIQQRPETDKT